MYIIQESVTSSMKKKKKKRSKRNSLIRIDGTSSKVRHVSKSVLHSGYLEKRSQTFGAIRRWTTKYFKLTHKRYILSLSIYLYH